jgi:Adenine specific DNA methylase Mod
MNQNSEELSRKVHELEKKVEQLNAQLKEKRFGLTWIDVPEAFEKESENKIPVLEEVSELSIHNKDGKPTHILIEGDNYHALTCLVYTHKNLIDLIYFDPPYNTGKDDFIYRDKRFLDQFPDGTPIPHNHPLRHSSWLSFMEKRLKLAFELLSDRGVMFISIDDNEQARLKLLCDQIIGEDKFAGDIAWQRSYSPRNDSKGISAEKEHILVYSKNAIWTPKTLPRTKEMNSKYKNPDHDIEPWRSSDAFAPSAATHQGMVYGIQHPFTGKMIYPYKGACWPFEQSKMFDEISKWANYKYEFLDDDKERADVCGLPVDEIRKGIPAIILSDPIEIAREKAKTIYKTGPWPKFFFSNKGMGGIARKTYLSQVKGKIVTNLWLNKDVGHTDEAKKEIAKIFEGEKKFDTPKPLRLIERIINISTDKNSIILDFFGGSGTTMHATLNVNRDGGSRQCILCQINEGNICKEVTYIRNKKAIEGYIDSKGKSVDGLGNSLKYYRTSFVGKSSPKKASDNDRLELAKKAGCMLSLAENTLYEVCSNDYFQFYTNEQNKWTTIYFQEDYSKFDEFKERVLSLEGKKIVYVFCWTDGAEFATEFEFEKDVEVKSIPQPILDIYKSLNV